MQHPDLSEIFLRVIQASLEELVSLLGEIPSSQPLHSYARALRAYHAADLAELQDLARSLEGSEFGLLVKTRLACREGKADPESLRLLEAQFSRSTGLLQGEIAFVVARAKEITGQLQEASDWYRHASHALESAGADKKAIKALHNFVAIESRRDAGRKLLPEFFHVYRRATRAREPGVAAFALMNISREYEKVGAFKQALRFVDRALKYLEPERGSLDHYLALLHRSHILFSMNRAPEALLDYEEAKVSEHPEVQAAIQVLEEKFLSKPGAAALPLTPAWNSRRSEKSRPGPLGDLEEKLVRYISEEPRDKFDIIEYLYGESVNLEAAENRLKNLMNRIRKKLPGMILLENGRYRVADRELIPPHLRKRTG